MSALSDTGKEGTLRARYVERLAATEDQLQSISQREADLRAELHRLEEEVEQRLQALG